MRISGFENVLSFNEKSSFYSVPVAQTLAGNANDKVQNLNAIYSAMDKSQMHNFYPK